MKNTASTSLCGCGALASIVLLVLPPLTASAQNCTLPAFPDSTITTTQDRDHTMCQLGLTFPVLPVRQGTGWPWNDPTAPTNAWPKNLANPQGNWTDAQSHTIVRTAWGNWHTYDADPMYEPDPSVHYPDPSILTGSLNGGAMSGVGTYGPTEAQGYPLLPVLLRFHPKRRASIDQPPGPSRAIANAHTNACAFTEGRKARLDS